VKPDPTAAIVADGLSRRFGTTVAVDDLSFRVARGEIFALLGPDGAGKTTTLRMLCGALSPSAGRIIVGGIDLARDPAGVQARIGYMPQRFSLYGDLSVQENLDFYADLFEIPATSRAQRMARLLEFSGLADFRGRLAEHLSGGMRQKLALACTLIHAPTVLLLDEPTTGVDPVSRREFWRILYDLHRDGATILVSTPYMDEAERSTTVGLMYQSRLISIEDPQAMKGRMRGEVVEVLAEPKAAARRILKDTPDVLSLTVFGDRLHLIVPSSTTAIPAVTARLTAQGIQVREARQVVPSLEDVFIALIEERRGVPSRGPEAGRA
jgi:ABC-2 type transport system ATP-binding protein